VTADASSHAPLVLFAYNRPDHLRRTLASLTSDPLRPRTRLFVYSDGPATDVEVDRVAEVRRVLDGIDGWAAVEVVRSEANRGLSRSVIAGVSEVLAVHGRAIVVEDDLEVSPRFLWFLNRLLEAYAADPEVFSVSGYSYPPRLVSIPADYVHSIYFGHRAYSWGWATWRDRWDGIDWEVRDYERFSSDRRARKRFDLGGADLSRMLDDQMAGRIDSWAVRWCYASFRGGKLNAHPVRTLVRNVGLDCSGVHSGPDRRLEDRLDPDFPAELRLPDAVEIDPRIVTQVKRVFGESDLLGRVRRRLRSALSGDQE